MNNAVLLVTFNRPDTTAAVFDAIRMARPPRLYVAADGPRPGRAGEKELCRQARQCIDRVDWMCDVKTLFREENMGCGPAVSSAIDWFFSYEEQGIILEDDCVAGKDFFPFCDEMLEYYFHDTRVMHISGNNFLPESFHYDASYYFSRYPLSWGWATWRRAWNHYDFKMKNYQSFKRENIIVDIFPGDSRTQKRWLEIFDLTYAGDSNFNTWDFQWVYANFCQNGLSVTPRVNMVKNIGVQKSHDSSDRIMLLAAEELGAIIHPEFMLADSAADSYIFKLCLARINLLSRILSKLNKKLFGKRCY